MHCWIMCSILSLIQSTMPCWWIRQKRVKNTHDQKISEGVDVVHPSRYDLYLLYRSMNWSINSFDTYHSKYRSITDVADNISHFGRKNKNWSVQITDLHCESCIFFSSSFSSSLPVSASLLLFSLSIMTISLSFLHIFVTEIFCGLKWIFSWFLFMWRLL